MARIRVRVAPASRHEALSGWMGDTLKLRVQAPPEKGRANTAVCDLLARRLGCPKSAIKVVSGTAARDKIIEIEGWSLTELQHTLP